MAKSFSQLRKNRSSRLEQLTKAFDGEKKPSYKNKDERFWKLTRDDAGNGSALIRFLDAPKEEDYAWVRYFDHGFQGPGGWFIEKSLTSIGKDDPVSEHNRALFQTGLKDNEQKARSQKRRLHYVSNILVIKDPKNSDNDGKVFLYSYGKKIFELLESVMFAETDELTGNVTDPINPFCMWEGANLKLRVRMADKFPTYDKSEFEISSPIFEDMEDTRYETLFNSQHSLQDLISPDKFKTYDQLKARLDRVLGGNLPDVTNNNSVTESINVNTVEEVELDENLGTEYRETEYTEAENAENAENLDFLTKLAEDS